MCLSEMFKSCDRELTHDPGPIGTSFMLSWQHPEDPFVIKTLIGAFFTLMRSEDKGWKGRRIQIEGLRWL